MRKRKRHSAFKIIAAEVNKIPCKKPLSDIAKPFNVTTNVSAKSDDFHERQRSAHCGLHSVHNLLRSVNITRKEMDKAAMECAKESGDSILNHKHFSGFWSMDAIIRCLENNNYGVKRAVKCKGKQNYSWDLDKTMYQLLDDDTAYGFIIHEPYHYTCYRKTKSKEDWEYSNSYNTHAVAMSPHEFCKQALEGVWNVFLVYRKVQNT